MNNNIGTWDVVWIQPLTGSQQVIYRDLNYQEAINKKLQYDSNMTGFAGAVIIRGK